MSPSLFKEDDRTEPRIMTKYYKDTFFTQVLKIIYKM